MITTRFESMLERIWIRDRIEVTGIRGTMPVALLLSQLKGKTLRNRPHIVVTGDLQKAESLVQDLKFFEPQLNVSLLSGFEVPPLSGISTSRRLITSRLAWLDHARVAKGGDMFVAYLPHLLQRTLPLRKFVSEIEEIRIGFELNEEFYARLQRIGYRSVGLVEDVGTFSQRGHVFDIFSPAHNQPIRLELFGDRVEALRTFDPESQRSGEGVASLLRVVPASEVILDDETKESFLRHLSGFDPHQEVDSWRHSIYSGQHFQGIENLIPLFYPQGAQSSAETCPLNYFSTEPVVWLSDVIEIEQAYDSFSKEIVGDIEEHSWMKNLRPESFKADLDSVLNLANKTILLNSISLSEEAADPDIINYSTKKVLLPPMSGGRSDVAHQMLRDLKQDGFAVFISSASGTQAQRLSQQLVSIGFEIFIVDSVDYDWSQLIHEQGENPRLIHIFPRTFTESIVFSEEKLVFLKEKEILEKSRKTSQRTNTDDMGQIRAINFGDLKAGEPIVHTLHGVGIYEGLKVLDFDGTRSEFLQIRYKDSDKLYVPVYKLSLVNKFSAPFNPGLIDKLGGTGWEKAKIKVKHHLREVASDLLRLYAVRGQLVRPPYANFDSDLKSFEAEFPYQETEDQLKSIEDIQRDLQGSRPMDRLICGDVGFGKTEIAMRAAFLAVQNGKQVAILVPTTTLSFQHDDNFKKRFKKWPMRIESLSRFTSSKKTKEITENLKTGAIDILIGTHKLFSREIQYKNLGLLIIDEEQRFGVVHKEKIRKLRNQVDTLTLSATPIPRTLNMSLMGIRDLSIINTPPLDRHPVRTYVMKYNKDSIKKAVESELKRGGQVIFVHNRVQSIYQLQDELKELMPKVRIRVGHGQMKEHELEETMLAFFAHEFDVLLCTTIIESGMDIPRTNTILIDRADTFGLSQLYQLRGRVGRSTERAYCFLFVPPQGIDSEAQERLRVLQDNTNLGSGLRISQYDLEMRGAGDILGESQSGHANAVGYDLYMELLQEAIKEVKGEAPSCVPEPEVNIKIPAFIPDSYMPDIRMRLAFYKLLSDARSNSDVDKIEDDLRDRFGPAPDEVLNLMGTVLIRNICKEVGIREVTVGPKNITLSFADTTRVQPSRVIQLVTGDVQKYKILPNNKLLLRVEKRDWASIYQEILSLA